jgi:hypothetical protein
MPATLHGETGNFGIESAETGIIVTDISFDYSVQEKTVANHEGDIVGVALYQDAVEIKVSGLVAAQGGFSSKVGDALSLTNSIPDHAMTGGGLTIITSISRTRTSEDFEKLDVTAKNWPNVTGGA